MVTHTDSPAEPSAEVEDPEEEEIIPPDFPFNIEEDIFFDYGNTMLYTLQKRPPVPSDPPDNLDKASLRETVKRVAAVLNSEWVQEGETSPEIIQSHALSLAIPCHVEETTISALYSPTVGVNIISTSFASDHLGEKHVTPTIKSASDHLGEKGLGLCTMCQFGT